MDKYSQDLLDETKDYFSGLYKREISDDEAESFLDSLVNFYDSFN
jgi:hypothetical protein